jgi:pilus assembly protein Flp/PilA
VKRRLGSLERKLIHQNHLSTTKKRRKTMKKFMELIKREDGVTAPEYALIAALVAVFIITAVTALGGSVSNAFDAISDAIDLAIG